jgi:hypothetical protein
MTGSGTLLGEHLFDAFLGERIGEGQPVLPQEGRQN